MPGHLFVVRGDLTQLACDAWLLPTSRSLWIESHWLDRATHCLTLMPDPAPLSEADTRRGRKAHVYGGVATIPDTWKRREIRTFEWMDWTPVDGHVRPWLTAMANDDSALTVDERARWYADGARQFVLAAAEKLRGKPAANHRRRTLLALPVVGTGAGGGSAEAGAVIKHLVRVLLETVQTVDADVVIVTHTGDQFAAVQKARRELVGSETDPWAMLPDHLRQEGDGLAAHANAGQLVLFLGAGVSVGAGLPTWNGLLEALAQRAGLTDDERKALNELQVLDQARIIRDRLERPKDGASSDGALANAIVRLTKTDQYGLTHALLASLPVAASVTTNYDTLFEDASNAAGQPTAVLPYASTKNTKRWLLKMHGCVTHPEDIVLTREDFLRYANRRGALAGIVQALLITRHMLFVGFSLTDDNFLRIADEVRRVMRLPATASDTAESVPFGTALLLSHAELLPSLWAGDINCVSISETRLPSSASSEEKRAASAKAANELEILLDFVLAESSQNIGHLLDQRYDGLLSDEEGALRDMLNAFQTAAAATPSVRDLPAWKPIQALLESLGAGQPGSQS